MFPGHSLAKRGFEVAHGLATKRQDVEKPEIPPVAALIFLLTFFAFFITLAAVSYTYGHLITTLAMVESSSSTAYVPIQSVEPAEDAPPAYTEDGDEGAPKPVDAEVNLVRTQPITSSLRGTVLHLKSKGGFWSRFRGFQVQLVLGFGRSSITGLLSVASHNPIFMTVAAIVAEIALANIHMTWIHVIISEPSTKKWYQRIPTPYFKTWKKIAPAVALWAVTSQVVTILPMLVTGSFGVLRRMHDPHYDPGMKEAYATAGQLFFAMILTLSLFILVQIPATVAMVRVAASMLPEEDETIVPFDRTFGGLTTPEIIGGQGKIGIVEAWKSFNGECRRRLLRTVFKAAAIFMAVWFLFTFVLMLEAHLLFGPAFGEMMKNIHGMTHRRPGP